MYIYLQENISDNVLFSTDAGVRVYNFLKSLRFFPVKFVNFPKTSFLEKTLGRLLVISSIILDELLSSLAKNLEPQ